MTDESPRSEPDLAAGDFSSWLADLRGSLRGEHGSVVPCDGCTACCTSSQFVHIAPDETDTLAHIPAELLFPAPGRAAGHVVLGYDERGHCPMLVDHACSIYQHRPRTCRVYDCRVFAAAGVLPDSAPDRQAAIARRASRWQFSFPTDADRQAHAAVAAAARYLQEAAARPPGTRAPAPGPVGAPAPGPAGAPAPGPAGAPPPALGPARAPAGALLPTGTPVPTDPTQLAVLAVEIHEAFLPVASERESEVER